MYMIYFIEPLFTIIYIPYSILYFTTWQAKLYYKSTLLSEEMTTLHFDTMFRGQAHALCICHTKLIFMLQPYTQLNACADCS